MTPRAKIDAAERVGAAGRANPGPGSVGEAHVGTVADVAALSLVWLAVVAWVATIHALAGDDFSASSTSRFLGPLLRWLFPEAGPELLERVHFALRKGAHFVEYALLGLLCMRALRLSAARVVRSGRFLRLLRQRVWIAGASVLLVFAVAIADESRQARSSQRTGAALDVGLDLGGGIAAGALVLLRWRKRRPEL